MAIPSESFVFPLRINKSLSGLVPGANKYVVGLAARATDSSAPDDSGQEAVWPWEYVHLSSETCLGQPDARAILALAA
jgi:hypothetical protein